MNHIFISYSHKDTNYAYKLADALQSKGFDVWIDARLDYGSQWPLEIQKQLDACGAFILIMSPRAFASEWVQSELQRAKRKLRPIFPLLLEGDEPWLSVESTQFYDVRGEKIPDAKFYSTLKRILTVDGTVSKLRLPKPQVKAAFVTTVPLFNFKAITSKGIVVIFLFICSVISAGAISAKSLLPKLYKNFPIATETSPAVASQITPAQNIETVNSQQLIQTGSTDISNPITVLEIESLLNQANISISTGSPADIARVRTYFTGPTSTYQLLAVNSLQVIGENHFKKTVHLDMIDKWYTISIGNENYVSSAGALNLEKLKEAMVKAHNEYYGDNVLLLDHLLEANP